MKEELITIEITGAEELAEKLREAAEGLRGDRLLEPWERVVEFVASSARELCPTDLGVLLGGIDEEVLQDDEGLTGAIFSDTFYAPFQERGTDPYFPNLDNLEDWAERHDTTAWVVALAIARRGIRPQKFFGGALEKNQDLIFELIGEAVGRVLEMEY